MAIQYAVIEGQGAYLVGYYWQFETDTFGANEGPSYGVWIIPGTIDFDTD